MIIVSISSEESVENVVYNSIIIIDIRIIDGVLCIAVRMALDVYLIAVCMISLKLVIKASYYLLG